jgi:SAM-dependent methyltransferase
MRTAALQELHDLESTYWWHVGRLSIIEKQLQKITHSNKKLKGNKANLLNVGSGTGGTLPILEKFGSVHNVDTSKDALHFLEKNGYKGTPVKGLKLPFKDNTFDIVTALDVLEHIKDDDIALAEWLRVLKPGGSLLLTVPAYQWLWSQHDVINNHHRRYLKKNLRTKIKKTGFIINKSSYAIVFSFPMVAGSRLVSKVSRQKSDDYSSFVKLPTSLNNLFISFLKLEARAQKQINFPLGTSILVVAQKQSKDSKSNQTK